MSEANEKAFKGLCQWAEEAFLSIKMLGCGPTISGERVQARFSFFHRGKNRTVIRCLTLYRKQASNLVQGVGFDFTSFCDRVLRIQKEGMSSPYHLPWSNSSVWLDVINHLQKTGVEAKTEPMRISLQNALKEKASSGLSYKKMSDYNIKKAKKSLLELMTHGFQNGLTEEDMHGLIKEAMVLSILKT